MNQAAQEKLWKYIICILLAIVTCAAFASVAGDGFIAFDDRSYVIGNANIQHGFSWKTIKWAFTAVYSSNWHPLTWLSHTLDYSLYSLDPTGPHLTNLAFHIANTILLFLLVYNLTVKLWPAAFVAMLFGIHPMHVESVAWVSERKDVLSTFFFLLTLLAYARYVELSRIKKAQSWEVYGLALLLFALGLMAKPMLVTLPGILLLLDYWPLGRYGQTQQRNDAEAGGKNKIETREKKINNGGKNQSFAASVRLKARADLRRMLPLIAEKIPFILLSVLSCWVTYIAQKSTGAVKLEVLYSTGERLAHVPVAYAWYVLKLFWPVNLSIYHRLPYDPSSQDPWFPLLILLCVTALALWRARRYPWLIIGWFWFIGTLVPVVGVVQVGNQAYADRYTYIPYIGLFFIIAWGLMELLARVPHRQFFLWAMAILITSVCFWRTVIEVHYWKNSLTLFNRAIALNPKDEMTWMLLGLEYEVRGNTDKAIECETRATTINDNFNLAWHNLGHMLVVKGDYPGAINAFQTSLACTWYSGDKINIYDDLGDAYMATGQYAEAIPNYQSSLELSTNQPLVLNNLGECFLHARQSGQALAAFQTAVNLQPDNRPAQLNLAMMLSSAGRDEEAIPHYWKVIELDTNVLIALNNLSWMLATDSDPKLRNGKQAMFLALHACERTHYQQAFLIGTLAAAYAETGEFDKAAAAAQKAHDVALAHGQKEIAERNAELMKLYQSGKPFHMDQTKK